MSKKKDPMEENTALPEDENRVPGGAGGRAAADAAASPGEAQCAEKTGGLEVRVRALEEEASDLKDKLLRKQADFENFRKRMNRDNADAVRYANAGLLSDLISVIDDFERAIRSAEESKDFGLFLTGVSMIERQLVEMLEARYGLKRFSSLGESFDPNKHEAVLRVEGPPDGRPTVVEDYQKGYFLHERVLRPAKVKVMVPAAAEGGAVSGGNGGPDSSSGGAGPAGPGGI
jgi:molecular chaperone GrpE